MSSNPADRLFRSTALDRLASPEQLDELITVADPRGWVAGIGIAVLTAALLAWGFLGSIPTEVPAEGILVTEGGRVVGALSPAAGVIETVNVHLGDLVERGRSIATIRQTGNELRVAGARQVQAEREAQLAARTAALQRQSQDLAANAAQRKLAQTQVIAAASGRIERLQRQLAIREQLSVQHLTIEDRVEQTRADLARAQEDVSAAKAHLVEIDSELLRAKLDADRELAGLQSALADARRSVSELSSTLNESRDVLAPETGHVRELAVSEGQLVTANALVANVESAGRRLQAVVYVPTEHGKKIATGMTVRVALSTVKKEEWGTLLGHVSSIADFPATPEGMAAVLQNSQLVKAFGGRSPPYEARIDLIPAETVTGYAWSSGKGPPLDLTSGTTLTANIAVREEPPINLILPFLRQIAGIAR